MKPTKSIRERLLGPLDAERYVAFEEAVSIPPAQRIPLLKEGLSHWDRVLREKCAEGLAKSVGAKAVPDILAARLSVAYKMALMKYCESPDSIDFIERHFRHRDDWAAVGSTVLAGYHKESSILWILGWEGTDSVKLKRELHAIPEINIAQYLARLSIKNRDMILRREDTRQYLKGRGIIDICEQFEEKARKAAKAQLETAEALRKKYAEAAQKRKALAQKAAEIQAVRSAEYEALVEKLRVDNLCLGQFIVDWKRLDKRYRKARLKKKAGGFREIAAPDEYLKSVQRKILEQILGGAPMHDSCHGFRRTRSVRTNAQPHLNPEMLINIDLKDFFPSITANRVYGVFKQLGFGDFQSSFLTRLTTYKGVLPQGAPTSPALANLAASRMDSRLNGLAEKIGASYTRYADDLTFSGPESMLSSLPMVRKIITEESFQIAEHKFRIARPKDRQEVTGLTVNEKLSIPRSVRKKIRAVAHHVSNGKKAVWRGKPVDKAALIGLAAYVRPFHSELAEQCTAAAESMKKKKRR